MWETNDNVVPWAEIKFSVRILEQITIMGQIFTVIICTSVRYSGVYMLLSSPAKNKCCHQQTIVEKCYIKDYVRLMVELMQVEE